MRLRGIIDRLDVNDAGELVVVDYKTGRPPAPTRKGPADRRHSTPSSANRCWVAGRPRCASSTCAPDGHHRRAHRRPSRASGVGPSAVWRAIERACDRGDFRPRASGLCRFCEFPGVHCPLWTGPRPGPTRSGREQPRRHGRRLVRAAPGQPVADSAAAWSRTWRTTGWRGPWWPPSRGAGRGPAGAAPRSLALAGTVSFAVNAAVKRSVRRGAARGAVQAGAVRPPTSSSFPSGHTLAAFCTAWTWPIRGAELMAYLAFAGRGGQPDPPPGPPCQRRGRRGGHRHWRSGWPCTGCGNGDESRAAVDPVVDAPEPSPSPWTTSAPSPATPTSTWWPGWPPAPGGT